MDERTRRSRAASRAAEGRSQNPPPAEAISVAPSLAELAGLSRWWFNDWLAEYDGRTVRVQRRGLRYQLYIDENVRDTRIVWPWHDPAVPIVSAFLHSARSDVVIIEVFVRGFPRVQTKIVARGRRIGGDLF